MFIFHIYIYKISMMKMKHLVFPATLCLAFGVVRVMACPFLQGNMHGTNGTFELPSSHVEVADNEKETRRLGHYPNSSKFVSFTSTSSLRFCWR